MNHIFVNLKRFEVSRALGGLCDFACPEEWISFILQECQKSGLNELADTDLTFFLPEALLPAAVRNLPQSGKIGIGCQSVYREDIKPGGNFGAFTANRPASAVKALGSGWSIIGHSEERKDKTGIITAFLDDCGETVGSCKPADTVSKIIAQECAAALDAGMKVLLCIGESADERGDGNACEQEANVKETLRRQLSLSLPEENARLNESNLFIAYEPIWAIGPGKTPPGKEYITFVSAYIKETVRRLCGFSPCVVYGGGLKEDNAAMLASIESIDGGLVALTRFSGEIGFYPDDLVKIINEYRKGRENK